MDEIKNESTKQQKKEKLRISFETEEFIGTCTSKFITSTALGKLISNKFKDISNDFIGVRFDFDKVNTNGILPCNMVFANNQKDPDKYKLVVPFASNANGGADFVTRFNTMNRAHDMLELTEDAKEMLADFVPNYSFYANKTIRTRNGKGEEQINWKVATTEKVYNNNYYGMNQNAAVCNLELQFDIIRFLKKLYGNTDSKGNTLLYMVNMMAPIGGINNNGMMGRSNNMLLNIIQVNKDYVQRMSEECFPAQNANNIVF